jgi:soluble lytic murein transglycosylase-like protein
MKIDKEALGLVKPPEVKHLPDEKPANDDSQVILTLRNTVSVLLGQKKKNEEASKNEGGKESLKNKKSILSKISLKGVMLTLGGIAALLAGKKAMASTAESASTAGSSGAYPGTSRADVDDADPQLDEINKSIADEVATPKVEKGPASASSTAPRTTPMSGKSETMLSKDNSESVDSAIARAAKAVGENVTWLRAMIHLESGGDPRARSTQYLGLGQIGKSAWEDIKSSGLKLPALTGGSDDPRYDPYLNALATAKLMVINRKRIASAVAAAGYKETTLGLLYAAHNLGAGTVNKMLSEKDSTKWDEQTKRFVANQASELTQGGLGNYLRNAEASMKIHYAAANVDVSGQKVAVAKSIGVMSSQRPQQLAASQRTPEPIQLASIEPPKVTASTSTSTKVKAAPTQVASAEGGGEGGSGGGPKRRVDPQASARTEEPFRLPNGQMASV